MTGSIPPANPLAYEGQVVVPFIMRTFGPQTTFNQFPVPTIWINTSAGNAYILVSKALGVADWVLMGAASGALNTITTPDSTVVTPVAGNINFLESGSISITGSGDNVTFNATGGGLAWTEVTTTSQAMAVNSGYIANNAALVTLTLPATAAIGSTFEIMGKGTGGWLLAQNAGQTVYFGNMATTTGATGSLASTHQRDTLTVICVTADTDFQVDNNVGNITVV